jgi:hypothetical protein
MVPRTVFRSKDTQIESDSGPVNVTKKSENIQGRWANSDNEIDNEYIGEKATVR